jgi:NDP-4-keto-2,6-dideoxyhexose 3-C-methyltransferase
VADAETNDVNGGSFRVYAVHSENSLAQTAERRARVDELRLAESTLGLDRPGTYEQFGKRIHSIGERLRRCLEAERAAYRDVSVYGASTKGNTLLQVFGIGQPLIRSAAERNPVKWGKYTVGSWIPIVSEEEARSHSDDFLILPWHFLPEIRERERDFVARGGKLIVPLPEPQIIDERGAHPIP